jgi:hypothetical protein
MVQITSLVAVRKSKTFGTEVNGSINRIVRAVWGTSDPTSDDLVLVGERTSYMGNFFLPEKYPLTDDGVNSYATVLRAKLADGTLQMEGFTFSISELTGNTHKGMRNVSTGRISRKLDRAFKKGITETEAFQLVKADLENAANKTNKTIEWVDE